MTLTSRRLLTAAADRLRSERPELAAELDLSTPEALLAAKSRVAAGGADTSADGALVVCVVGRPALSVWVRETCRFASSVPYEQARPWRRAFTRTVFLAGQPGNLRDRFPFAHVAGDGSVGWLGPAAERDTEALRRLLKVFHGDREPPAWAPVTVTVPQLPGKSPSLRRPRHRDLYVATARVAFSALLVQVNHLLAEAVLDGLIAPGDRLTLRSVPWLTGLASPFAALRVDEDTDSPHGLRAFAGLTEET